MIKIYVRFSIHICKEGNNKISSFSKVTDVPQMSFFEICQFIFHQVQPHKNKHCAHAAANNNSTEIHYILLINLCR